MKRRALGIFAALLGVIAALFVVTAPSAFADRDTGWLRNDCFDAAGNDFYVGSRIIWHSGSNERTIYFQGTQWLKQDGTAVYANDEEAFSMLPGGTWTMFDHTTRTYNPPPAVYVINFTPTVNPGEGHYFTVRLYDDGEQCQSPIVLD